MKHLIYVGENDYNVQFKYKQYNDFSDMILIYIFILYVGSMYLFFKAMFILAVNKYRITDRIKRSKQKEIVIVRGVPGIGKDTYVYSREYNKRGTFTMVSSDQFFTNNRKYNFSRVDISKSEADCFDKFHLNVSLGVPRIYVTNVNNQKWMYNNYITLARSYNYNVKIVELVCNDKDELHYFNKRSIHNVPFTYSKNVFNSWEKDSRVEYIEPYMGTLPGDSLPYPFKTKVELDMELDNYRKIGKCRIHTNSDDEEDMDLKDMESIDYMSLDTTQQIEKRRLYTILFNIKNKKMLYLKLDLETEFIHLPL